MKFKSKKRANIIKNAHSYKALVRNLQRKFEKSLVFQLGVGVSTGLIL